MKDEDLKIGKVVWVVGEVSMPYGAPMKFTTGPGRCRVISFDEETVCLLNCSSYGWGTVYFASYDQIHMSEETACEALKVMVPETA